MNITNIISFVSLLTSVGVFITGVAVYFKDVGKERDGKSQKNANLLSTLDYIKIQTELINAQNKVISGKLDSQNDRLIVAEQAISSAHLTEVPEKLARLDEGLKSAHKRLNEIESKIK